MYGYVECALFYKSLSELTFIEISYMDGYQFISSEPIIDEV